MKILQKILSHGLLIAFFVAVFFVYLYRGDLFPQWFEQAQTVTPSASAPEQSAVVETQQSQPVQSEAVTDLPAVGDQPAEPAAPTADAASAAQYRPVRPEEASRQTYNPVAEAPASVTTSPEYRPLKARKKAPADGTAESTEAGFQLQLEQARQHYWRRDMPAAEQAYRRLTELYPERAEVWGELGNLFFSQREMVQATDSYYRAIELLIEQGDAERARQMLGAMQQLDAEKANELETRLRQAGR